MKYILFYSLIGTSLVFSSDSLLCSNQLNDVMQVSSDLTDVLDKVSNRDFDPCKEIVEPAHSKQEICTKKPRYFQNLLCQKNGKMGFENNKGLFGLPTGVCWWHSQFHRNATYLSYFNPMKPKLDPDKKEDKKKIKEIFNNIIRMKEITEIPGYSSLREFTEDPKIEKLLQKRLQKWMSEDSFLKMKWVNGVTTPNNYTVKSEEYFMEQNGYKYDPTKDHGSDKLNTKAQRQFERKTYKSKDKEEEARIKSVTHQDQEVRELFESVNGKTQISYLTLQYPGVMAHAQIVFDSKQSIVDGQSVYDFKVQDSNYQGANSEDKWSQQAYSQIRYKNGIWYAKAQKGSITEDHYEPINIKVHNTKQLDKVDDIYAKECGNPLFR